MSYILDALRRAEAERERERGKVPGLHTQPLASSGATPTNASRRWLPWAGAGLLLAGIGLGSWWVGGSPDAPEPVAMPAPVPAPPPAPQVAAGPLPQPATPPAAHVPSPAASDSPYLAPPAPVPPPAARAPVPAPVAEAPIPKLAELPDNLRREMPSLTISGSVYSDDPASRFVMINGEVLREGGKLGADLVLEQIRPRELVLRFKAQRFRLPV